MTNVNIIEVDLSEQIDTIISESMDLLTEQSQQEVDTAIALAKQRDKIKNERAAAKEAATTGITTAMENAYAKLAEAGTDGVLCSEIMDIVKDHVPNSSAFTLRMKKILREKGNPFSISRAKRKSNPHYIFLPFNQDDA